MEGHTLRSFRLAAGPYLVAVLATMLVVVLRLALSNVLANDAPLLLFVVAVMAAAWAGGLKPGLFATALSAAAGVYFFIERDGWRIVDVVYQVRILMFVFVGLLVSLLSEKMHANRRRAESRRELLQVTLASIGDAMISTDRDGRVTFLNAVAESLTGWRSGDATGLPLEQVFNIVNETTRNTVDSPATRALLEGIVVGLANHTVLIAKDGTERPIDDSAAPIRDEQGNTIGCVLIFRDVGEQRKVVRALEQSEARKTAMFEAALDAIVSIDHHGAIIEFNAAAEQTFGHRREAVLGRELAELLIPPAYRELHRKGLANYLVTGHGPVLNQRLELSALRADGSEFPVELTVTRVPVDGPPQFTAYLRDIADRQRTRHELQEAAVLAAFQADVGFVLTHSHNLEEMLSRCAEIIVRHLDGAFARVWTLNAQEAMLELQASAGLYTHLDGPHSSVPVGQFKIGRIAAERRPVLTNAVVGDERVHDQEWAQREGMVAFAGYPLLVEERLVGVVAMFARHELSEAALQAMGLVASSIAVAIEQKQQASELRKFAAEMSEADRRKNEFLAMLAHELRNPLAPIRNALQIMRLTGGDGEAVGSASEMMERQVGQMVRLVDDLLDVSRITRGKIELRTARIELASAVNHALEAARALAQCMDQEFVVTLPIEPIYLNADPTRLAQVVGNLLNNACKFNERGGHIWLNVEIASREREGPEAVIRVRDNGIGIAPEQLSRIFDMFMQLDTSLERSVSGLGIGLTMVKNLVEMHGGTVKAHSAGVGHGSEFIVRLPILADSPPTTPTPVIDQPPMTTARRILVVDDNRDSAASLSMLMKLNGNQTQTAFDGREAIEAAANFRPEVVLLDIGLPELNGYEVARKIREQPWGKEMVLIALTGWGQDEDRRKSQEAGFDGHLVKPADFTALMTLLAKLLPVK